MDCTVDLGARKRSQSEVELENFELPMKLSFLQYFITKDDFDNEKGSEE